EDQDFQINRMAAVALGELGRAESVDSMIRGLYLFGLGQPNMRMNDVAAEALVRIGRPSLGPLLRTLDGQNQDANDLAEAYIAAVRAVNPRAAAQTSVRQHVSSEAAFALGALGLPEAFPPLLAETESGDSARALQACIAMVRLLLPDAEREALREVLVSVYEALPDHVSGAAKRVQLLTVMKHTYDPKMLPFFQKEMNDRAQIPDVRIAAASAYATLANKEELRPIRRYVSQEQNPRDGRHDPMLDAAEECDVALRCWQEKLRSSDPVLASKASFMLGRLGRDNAAVISSLVSKLGDSSPEIRLAALAALDRVAVHGSQEAIDKIEELRVAEQGRSVWNVFGREALPVQARLRLRLES
ncbi:MAG: HEAT repeat domain-containing protein, partial [Myxococcota bacterium]